MKRKVTGHELLETLYKGNRAEFFKAIEGGKHIPYNPPQTYRGKELDGDIRIFPPHCDPLLKKIGRMEDLKRFLETDDETFLWGQFAGRYGLCNDEEEKFRRLKAEEGPELLTALSRLRPEWKEEFEKLRAEIGDPEEALSPSVVWRGVTLNLKDQKMLLEAIYLVDDGEPLEDEILKICFYDDGGSWMIGKKTAPQRFDPLVGLKRIQFLISSPNKLHPCKKLPTDDPNKKAERTAVKRTVEHALEKITKGELSFLGSYLNDKTLHLGTKCRYKPDPQMPVEWILNRPSL